MLNLDQYLEEIEQQYQLRDNEFNVPQHIQPDQEQRKSIFESILETRGEQAVKTLTRFTIEELKKIFEICSPHLHRPGRGRQFELIPVDMMLLTLTFLTTGSRYQIISNMFQLDDSLVCRTIHFTIERIAKPLILYFCQLPIYLDSNEKHFNYFPNAIGAIDTTFILMEKPTCREEQQRNWSYKHGTCGVKIQGLIRPNGLCTMFVANVPGSKHDIKIFNESGWLEKFVIPVEMPNGTRITSHLPVLFDKGYTGLNSQGFPEAIVTIKKPIGRDLTPQELEVNHRIESDRVIVENYFGRMKTIFGVMAGKFRGNREDYLTNIMEVCIALTNYHISLQNFLKEF